MFNKDFYPTPIDVIRQMLEGLDLEDKFVFDPSSGKGDILKLCRIRRAKTLGCEINDDLYNVSSKYAKMIGTDFLDISSLEISHIDCIVMNPPFSADIKHILHAYDIAPGGCEIRALCNFDTYQLKTQSVLQLNDIVTMYGSFESLGQCFSDSERKTNVTVGMITIKKPANEEQDWSEYFDYEELDEQNESGLMKHDEVLEIVGRYVGSLKLFKNVDSLSDEINKMMKPINMSSISFGCTMRNRNRGDIEHLSYGDFKIQLQKNAWSTVFNKMNMDKYMTAKLKEKISKFVEEQSETPFTRKNIYNMLQFVYDTNSNRMDDVLVEVFDTLTQHYDENRFHVEGWKTNSHYMINEKFIIPYMTKLRHGGGIEVHWNGNGNKVDDLTKALCYLTGQNYDDYLSLENWVSRVRIKDEDYYRNNADVRSRAESQFKHYSTDWRTAKEFNKKWTKETYIESCIETAIEKCEHYERREFGKWYDWGFFEVKGFKKGTMHFKFKDRKVWEFFNVRVGEIKGYELPESFCRKWDSPIKEESKSNEEGQLLLI